MYVSTVDSGNFVGSCLVTREALRELRTTTPLMDANALEALGDDLGLVEERVAGAGPPARSGPVTRVAEFVREVDLMRQRLVAVPRALSGWLWLFQDLSDRLTTLDLLLHEIEDDTSEAAALAAARQALGRVAAGLDARRLELRALTPIGRRRPGAPATTCRRWRRWRPRADLVARIERLERQLDTLIDDTEFAFLFEPTRRLFSIGFNVTDGRLDQSHYDTLASEARLASFLAIATGQVPQDHWFRLGRAQAPAGTGRVLLSWSASMFEYLMPLLVMRSDPGTLIHETCLSVVQEQIDYGARFSVPWGISESAYNARDLDGNYQYKAFGVPGLGLKRGLGDDLVVAPYASMLAASLRPRDVVANLDALDARRALEQLRLLRRRRLHRDAAASPAHAGAVVATVMAHHQGMTLVALDNCLNAQIMPRRFHRDQRIRAVELLLHERDPGAGAAHRRRPPSRPATSARRARRRRRSAAATPRRTRRARARTCCPTARTPSW